MRRILAALLGLAPACSTLPSRAWPAHEEQTVLAEYRLTGDQPIEVPVSGPDLTILEWLVEPVPVRERFQAGRRWLEPPPECPCVRVHCRYRAYAGADGRVPPAAALFPGATITPQPR